MFRYEEISMDDMDDDFKQKMTTRKWFLRKNRKTLLLFLLFVKFFIK